MISSCVWAKRVDARRAAAMAISPCTRATRTASTAQYAARKLVVATGYYDLPNRLNVPGEDLPHVSHYYTEPHPFWRQDVVVDRR